MAETREKHTVTKSDLVERLSGKTGLPAQAAEAAYEAIVAILAENIRAGLGTSFRGVGIVTAKRQPARKMRVPVSDEPVEVAARITTNFAMVRAFADSLKKSK